MEENINKQKELAAIDELSLNLIGLAPASDEIKVPTTSKTSVPPCVNSLSRCARQWQYFNRPSSAESRTSKAVKIRC